MVTENRPAGSLVLSALIALMVAGVAGVLMIGLDVSAESDRGNVQDDATLEQPFAVSVGLIELDRAPNLSSESCSASLIQGETLDDQEFPQMDHRPKCESRTRYRCKWVYIGGSNTSYFKRVCMCWPV